MCLSKELNQNYLANVDERVGNQVRGKTTGIKTLRRGEQVVSKFNISL